MKGYLSIIKISQEAVKPKYRQLAEAIIFGVNTGKIVKNDVLPSLHDYSSKLEISKNTVEKAYSVLKGMGLVNSFKGKGYYIK